MYAAVVTFSLLGFIWGLTSCELAAEDSLTISKSQLYSATPEQVWGLIKNFDAIQKWHPAIATSEITKNGANKIGTVRVLTTKDGAQITEELLKYEDKGMSYQYTIKKSPMPLTDFVADITIEKVTGGALLVWNVTCKAAANTPDENVRAMVGGFLDAGMAKIKTLLQDH